MSQARCYRSVSKSHFGGYDVSVTLRLKRLISHSAFRSAPPSTQHGRLLILVLPLGCIRHRSRGFQVHRVQSAVGTDSLCKDKVRLLPASTPLFPTPCPDAKTNVHGRDCPGRVALWFNPFSAVALVLGTTFPRPGMCGYYAGKFSCMPFSLLCISYQTTTPSVYKKFGATSFASVFISPAQPFFWLADPEALKIVASDRHTFQKDVVQYEIINIYGANLVSVEASDWKRHRSVAMSAFNEASCRSLTKFSIVGLT